jgi:hypothetical protein
MPQKVSSSLLLGALLLSAQTASAHQDPVSGVWTGAVSHGDNKRTTMTMTMKLEGRAVSGTVTGPTLNPADIRTGTFDPGTGAITLGIVVRRDGYRATFTGTAQSDSISGRVSFPDGTGTFTVARVPASSGAAPETAAQTAELRRAFDEVSGWVTKSADLVPADKYTYRPAETVRTFGQMIGHIADSYNYYCARAAGRDLQWSDAIEKGSTDKATLVPKLRQAAQSCGSAYGATGKPGALIDNIGHTSLHYGNLITYIRMMGLVPPSS